MKLRASRRAAGRDNARSASNRQRCAAAKAAAQQ